jgi:hypothetical protein
MHNIDLDHKYVEDVMLSKRTSKEIGLTSIGWLQWLTWPLMYIVWYFRSYGWRRGNNLHTILDVGSYWGVQCERWEVVDILIERSMVWVSTLTWCGYLHLHDNTLLINLLVYHEIVILIFLFVDENNFFPKQISIAIHIETITIAEKWLTCPWWVPN